MKLSIVIPVYNEERHVLDVLRRVAARSAEKRARVAPRGLPLAPEFADLARIAEASVQGGEARRGL